MSDPEEARKALDVRLRAAFGRLRQVGRFHVNRLWGTVKTTNGRYRSTVELFEGLFIMRAEMNALVSCLIDAGHLDLATFRARTAVCAEEHGDVMCKQFPEVEFGDHGYSVSPTDLAERCKREEWPP